MTKTKESLKCLKNRIRVLLNAIVEIDENIIQDIVDKGEKQLKVYLKNLSVDKFFNNVFFENYFGS